jgi:hypothetical protein
MQWCALVRTGDVQLVRGVLSPTSMIVVVSATHSNRASGPCAELWIPDLRC